MSSCPMDVEKLGTRLVEELSDAYRGIAVFACLAVLLIGLVVYCVYNMIKVILFYRVEKGRVTRLRQPSNVANVSSPADDNELYAGMSDKLTAENTDEYVAYNDNINKSIAEFKEYNEQLKTYYTQNKPGEEPRDLIDRGVVDIDNDSY